MRGDFQHLRPRRVAASLETEVATQVLRTRPQAQPAVELQLDEIVVRDAVEHRRLVPFAGEADLDAVLNGEQVFREARALEVRPAAFIRLALTVNADLSHGETSFHASERRISESCCVWIWSGLSIGVGVDPVAAKSLFELQPSGDPRRPGSASNNNIPPFAIFCQHLDQFLLRADTLRSRGETNESGAPESGSEAERVGCARNGHSALVYASERLSHGY
jgi:hypothetical protein